MAVMHHPERGTIVADFSFAEQRQETLRLLRRYDDTPMSFADACMVRMAELQDDSVVFTTDSVSQERSPVDTSYSPLIQSFASRRTSLAR